MYDNIGGKIKGLAKVIFIIEAIGTIIAGIVLLITGDLALFGLLILICGPLVAWVSSWILYAFGELVEDVGTIRYQVQHEKSTKQKSKGVPTSNPEIMPPNLSNRNKVFCEKCGADITFNKSACHVCKSKIENTTNKNLTIIEATETKQNDICETCGADISSDTYICHVCGKKI